jgi:hypothetical protein
VQFRCEDLFELPADESSGTLGGKALEVAAARFGHDPAAILRVE